MAFITISIVSRRIQSIKTTTFSQNHPPFSVFATDISAFTQ
nr:MAG TPA: hypothetical protein [Caudoviricetes sp.]